MRRQLTHPQVCQLLGNVIGVALLWAGETNDSDAEGSGGPSQSTTLLFYTFLAISVSALFAFAGLGHEPGDREWAELEAQQKEREAKGWDLEDPDMKKSSLDVRISPPLSEEATILGRVSTVFHLLADPRMYLLSGSILYLGLQQGFLAADITKSMILPTQGLAGIPMVLICFCFFDGIGCFVLGRLSDTLGKMIFIIVGVSAHLAFYGYFMYHCWSVNDFESIKGIDTVILYIGAGTCLKHCLYYALL